MYGDTLEKGAPSPLSLTSMGESTNEGESSICKEYMYSTIHVHVKFKFYALLYLCR